ncbi:MAG TPA: cation:proton antiporter [Candidatus Thermoplasmatota archaeon]
MVLVPLGVLGIGVALGLHLGKRARTIAIPVLFGFGLLMGGNAFGFLPHDDFLESATEIGLLLMLFYTSLFGNPRALRDGGRIGLPLAAYDLIVNFAIAWWIGDFLDWGARDRLFLAGIMATSSTAVVLKILGDENRISRREGNVLVSMLLIEDWIFLLFFAFLGLRYGAVPSRSAQEFGLGVLAFVGFLVILRLLRHQIWSLRSREMQIALLTSIGLLGAFLGISAGLPSIGSAFTTGLVLSGEQGARFSQREAPYLREAASALFFVGYGAMLGPALALSLIPLLGLALGGILASQLLLLPVLARRLGLRRSESFITGALLLPRGGKSAAFAKLYPTTGGQPLFPLAGLLAVVLTPLTPVIARIGIALSGRRSRLAYADPGESFSRSARSLLMPHAYVARHNGSFVARVVLCELLLLAGFLAFLTLAAPRPWNWAAAGSLAVTLVGLAKSLRHVVTQGPGGPRARAQSVSKADTRNAFDHLPILLVAPLALLLLLAIFSPWALIAYPILLGLLWLGALVLPWIRPHTRRAPPLARALGVSGILR